MQTYKKIYNPTDMEFPPAGHNKPQFKRSQNFKVKRLNIFLYELLYTRIDFSTTGIPQQIGFGPGLHDQRARDVSTELKEPNQFIEQLSNSYSPRLSSRLLCFSFALSLLQYNTYFYTFPYEWQILGQIFNKWHIKVDDNRRRTA